MVEVVRTSIVAYLYDDVYVLSLSPMFLHHLLRTYEEASVYAIVVGRIGSSVEGHVLLVVGLVVGSIPGYNEGKKRNNCFLLLHDVQLIKMLAILNYKVLAYRFQVSLGIKDQQDLLSC